MTVVKTRLDAILLAVLIALTTVAWCAAYGKWSPAAWALPAAYLEPDKSDVVHALAMMKAGTQGEFLPLAWKQPSRVGAPGPANWNDWPLVEELQVVFLSLLAKLFGLFAGLNLGMLSAQLLAAATFYLTARWIGCLPIWSFVGGLAYGLAPFIFAQSPFHITTVFVWHVPLFLLVWRQVATGEGLVWGSREFWFAIALAFVTGLQSPYFTNIFCQVTLLGAGVLAWQRRSWQPLKPALAVVAAAAAAFALMNLDTWTYRLAHGPNPGALVREYKWLEIYGLKLVDLVIPPVTHRAEPFAAFAAAHRSAAPLLDEGSYLGLVGIAALGLLITAAAAALLRGRADEVPLEAWVTLWIVLTFTTGGLNAILGAFGFTLFRTGCRYSIVILALALLYAARRLSDSQREAEARTAAAGRPADTLMIATLTAAAGLVAMILFDQVPRGPTPEQAGDIARQVAADGEFVQKIEAALPTDAMVFQLPVMDFPESPLPGIPSYDHFRPYLYSDSLRFSFGSMKGREQERWQQEVQQQLVSGARVDQEQKQIRFDQASVRKAVDEVKRRGFAAVYINRNAFPDRGKGLEEAFLELGYTRPPLRNATGDLACIVLTP
jgi:hypothetical protein